MKEKDSRQSRLHVLRNFLRRLFRRRPKSPGDPYADILVPVRSGPRGRSGAVVAEPEDDSFRIFPQRNQ